jgi:ABC-type transport system involved in multi-copper enzyme maturation permease subunit
MHAQLLKEWRLLRPGVVAALGLTLVPLLLPVGPEGRDAIRELLPMCLFIGGVLVGIETFGREFHQQTSTLWLAQPRSRSELWWSKASMTGLAVAGVTLVSWAVLLLAAPSRGHLPNFDVLFRPLAGMLGGAALGLFWSVTLRQTWAAFWMSLIVPGALMTSLVLLRVLWPTPEAGPPLNTAALFRYSFWLLIVVAFVLARRRFEHLEDLGAVGEDVQLKIPWLGASVASAKTAGERRVRSASVSLGWKEIRMQQVNIALAGGFVVVMIVTQILKSVALSMPERFGPRDLDFLDFMWALWSILPLTIGMASMAEERRLGVDSWQETLPVSRARRWWIKTGTAFGLSLLIGVIVPVLGMKLSGFKTELEIVKFLVVAWLLLTAAGLYVSSLARNLVHAISILVPFAIVLALALTGGIWLVRKLGPQPPDWYAGIPHNLHFQIVMLALFFVILLWLGWKNSAPGRAVALSMRLNATSLVTTWIAAVLLVVGMRHRAWEWLRPEPSPLPALTAYPGVKPDVVAGHTHAAVLTPDGNLWSYGLPTDGSTPYPRGTRTLRRLGESHRWLSMGASEIRVVALRSDGTLWQWGPDLVPDPDRPGRLLRSGDFKSSWETPTQIGTDTDWTTVSVSSMHGLALKRDGTLWVWGHGNTGQLNLTNRHYMKEPRQLGASTNWTCIAAREGSHAANRDGKIWTWGTVARMHLLTETDSVWEELMTIGQILLGRNEQNEIRMLKAWSFVDPNLPVRWEGSTGRDMILDHGLAWAIDGQGRLLRWGADTEKLPRTARLPTAAEFSRVGRRNDWVALDAGWGLAQSVGLTADGGLWIWGAGYGERNLYPRLLPLSQRPRRVALLRADTP